MAISARDLDEIYRVNEMFIHHDHWGDLFEEVTLSLYSAVLGHGDSAVDCGTNHGVHTRAMARSCGPGGRVFAFEAAPEMMARTKAAVAGFTNVSFFEKALWHSSGQTLTFHFYPNEDGLSGLRHREGTTGHVPLDVVTTTLDESVDTPVSLIKLDVEGGEYHALQGARRIMRDDRPIIVFESGRQDAALNFGYGRDDFFALFEASGYHLYSIAGVPLVRENWDAMMPWQFMAIHPESARMARAFAATQAFVHRLRSNNR